jgi:hypothetical protein
MARKPGKYISQSGLSRPVSAQSGSVDLQRAGERVTSTSNGVKRRIGKLAEELAGKPKLRAVVGGTALRQLDEAKVIQKIDKVEPD